MTLTVETAEQVLASLEDNCNNDRLPRAVAQLSYLEGLVREAREGAAAASQICLARVEELLRLSKGVAYVRRIEPTVTEALARFGIDDVVLHPFAPSANPSIPLPLDGLVKPPVMDIHAQKKKKDTQAQSQTKYGPRPPPPCGPPPIVGGGEVKRDTEHSMTSDDDGDGSEDDNSETAKRDSSGKDKDGPPRAHSWWSKATVAIAGAVNFASITSSSANANADASGSSPAEGGRTVSLFKSAEKDINASDGKFEALDIDDSVDINSRNEEHGKVVLDESGNRNTEEEDSFFDDEDEEGKDKDESQSSSSGKAEVSNKLSSQGSIDLRYGSLSHALKLMLGLSSDRKKMKHVVKKLETGEVDEMWWRVEKDNSVTIKARGIIDQPLDQVLAYMYEGDHQHLWIPNLYHAKLVKKLSRSSVLLHQTYCFGRLIGHVDNIMVATGINALHDPLRAIIMVCRSPDEDAVTYEGSPIPDPIPPARRLPVKNHMFFLHPLDNGKTVYQIFTVVYPPLKYFPAMIQKAIMTTAVPFFVENVVMNTFKNLRLIGPKFEETVYKQCMEGENKPFYDWVRSQI